MNNEKNIRVYEEDNYVYVVNERNDVERLDKNINGDIDFDGDEELEKLVNSAKKIQCVESVSSDEEFFGQDLTQTMKFEDETIIEETAGVAVIV